MIILDEQLTRVKQVESNKEIKFSMGFISVVDQGKAKEWDISLEDIEDYGPILDLFASNKPTEFEFVCENGTIFYGKAAVTSILSSDILMKGTGPLKDGGDNIIA